MLKYKVQLMVDFLVSFVKCISQNISVSWNCTLEFVALDDCLVRQVLWTGAVLYGPIRLDFSVWRAWLEAIDKSAL